ncbi:(2Fe-2S)-binding protein [Xenophilus sp. AP218F]|nr:Rieske 2Fe-2S domain-containing protein [Chromobacterium sp. ASV5]OWY39561.1 (2Fe-2S)-binding protein [Xenophilus sp. AP218F]
MAAAQAVLICSSSSLRNGGDAARFTVAAASGEALPAFAIRYQGQVFAYLNRCRHLPIELDLQDGKVFDLSGHYLICSMHGARYLPGNGRCVGGPCRGQALIALDVAEHDGSVWLNVMPD